MAVILFRLEWLQFLPLARFEVRRLLLQHAAAESPSRARREYVDVLKERPILQHASADDVLSDTTRVGHPQLRAHLEDCLRFCREVKGILRLVVINPLQAVTVIEQNGRPASTVGD